MFHRRAAAVAVSTAPKARADASAPPSLHHGEPLPADLALRARAVFDFDFNAIRVYDNGEGDQVARAHGARAWAHGTAIGFRQGAGPARTPEGMRTLGHELAHVVQQARGGEAPLSLPGAPCEGEARAAGLAFEQRRSFSVSTGAAPGLARDPWSLTESRVIEDLPTSDLQVELQELTDWMATGSHSAADLRLAQTASQSIQSELTLRSVASHLPLRFPLSASDGALLIRAIRMQVEASPTHVAEFADRGVNVRVMPLGSAAIVARRNDEDFTEAAQRTISAGSADYVINSALYEGGYSFFDADDPSSHTPQGLIVEGRAQVGGRSSPDTFHLAWAGSGPSSGDPSDQWTVGLGDPPTSAQVASGGAKPLIIGNLPYGSRNLYAQGAPAGLPETGDPGTLGAPYLQQRSNLGFAAVERDGADVGKPIVGVERDANLLFIVVQGDGASPGMTLSELRDALGLLGVDDALMWDGSNSATLVAPTGTIVAPAEHKDNTIPFGLGFSPGR